MGFTVKRVPRRVLRRGSEKAVSRRCLERPLGEQSPLGVRPISRISKGGFSARGRGVDLNNWGRARTG